MNLQQLKQKFDIQTSIIEDALNFQKAFQDYQPVNFFMDGQTLIGTSFVEMEVSMPLSEEKKKLFSFMLIVRFTHRKDFSIAMETPIPDDHPIIIANGLLKQGELWKFESFDKLPSDLRMILQINEMFKVEFTEAKRLLDDFKNKKIEENVFDKEIRQYTLDYPILKSYIKKRKEEIKKSKYEEHLKQLSKVFDHMQANGDMNKEEMIMFKEKIEALYFEIV